MKVKVAGLCLTLCNPMEYTVHGILQARILEWVSFPFSKGSSQPRSPALQAESLLAEPPEKSKNTGVGSLSLIQQSFQTQESNRGLLHCKWILYQLSYLGTWLDSLKRKKKLTKVRCSSISGFILPWDDFILLKASLFLISLSCLFFVLIAIHIRL